MEEIYIMVAIVKKKKKKKKKNEQDKTIALITKRNILEVLIGLSSLLKMDFLHRYAINQNLLFRQI
jgi:hypothetical protein